MVRLRDERAPLNVRRAPPRPFPSPARPVRSGLRAGCPPRAPATATATRARDEHFCHSPPGARSTDLRAARTSRSVLGRRTDPHYSCPHSVSRSSAVSQPIYWTKIPSVPYSIRLPGATRERRAPHGAYGKRYSRAVRAPERQPIRGREKGRMWASTFAQQPCLHAR